MINKHNEKLLNRYLMVCKTKGLTEKSIDAFKVDLTVFLRYLKDKPIEEVSHIDCEDFLNTML